ncbi:prolyl oligopeptidase family serine peptidase [Kozakia baliensis]|uniref:Prolyl oligopeptidase n=1 Tax=Kozakia baliensis TaxID=153496 RepID=A0A1D8UUV5_9PROT|nr:prolyl oligopeptidase family serine peptidase [Kozakia baliensis]AOX17426.1 prolyl oligopeptidase [Kozakia baliensis]GBR30463.1 prolyl oligopeptidase [Kozakia baliensis NRIC 0488]GEL63118.1 prolyl oligopeptidase [Kozakia baliensis]
MTARVSLFFHRFRRLALAATMLALPTVQARAASTAFLDQIDGKQALDWVKQHDQKTLDTLRADPRFPEFQRDALRILQSQDRIPMPMQWHGAIYNFWRDAKHVRGILRRTDAASYRSATPHWVTVLDVDALAAQEHRNWFLGGIECREPDETRCMIALSEGGEDAQTLREFDLLKRHFVPGGFELPHAKQSVAWLNADTLLVSRPWEPGELTHSSYPYVVKAWHRGTKPEAAVELFRGSKQDMTVNPLVLFDRDHHVLPLIAQAPTFFTKRFFRLVGNKTLALDLPAKSDIVGLVHGLAIVRLTEAWRDFPAGSVISIQPEQTNLDPKPVVTPKARQMIQDVAVSGNRLLIALYDNVRGQAWSYGLDKQGVWQGVRLKLPEDVSVGIASSDLQSETAYFEVSGFLTPTELWQGEGQSVPLRIKTTPPRFDAHDLMVEQHEARSTDGTMVPYFVVRRRDLKMDGKNPTLLYAYGGFEVSMTPSYSGALGKLWLERGGTYVLANIRGGGEFGPDWHEAGRKTHRQRVFDDFASVARDLTTRKLTSPDLLAIKGGSNGGLLMGVEFTQHPELWRGVIIQVPLLDMLNFENMSAGASWVDEYGSVGVPEERDFLAKISPLQNLKAGMRYPTPFLTTTTRDDRVGPVHARRFAARMDELHLPYFYYEQVEGGHSAGANQAEVAQEEALEYVYLWKTLMPS